MADKVLAAVGVESTAAAVAEHGGRRSVAGRQSRISLDAEGSAVEVLGSFSWVRARRGTPSSCRCDGTAR
jgi:hypothetical protein